MKTRTAVQQIMLGTVTGNEREALETLKKVKAAGYDGIELNGFMIRPTPWMVRALTRIAGMPTGKGGGLDWEKLVRQSGLMVPSIHEDLGTIEREPEKVVEEVHRFGAGYLVLTGMYRFDYGDARQVENLCQRLNQAGSVLKTEGIELLYHNHNIEWTKCEGKTAYERILEGTDPDLVGFEFDSYWPTEAGVDALAMMEKLGERMKLYHINDRGTRIKKTPITPILKSDSMELGCGNMNLVSMIRQAQSAGVDTIILESHKNWIDRDPIQSLTKSAEYLNRYTVQEKS